MATTVIDALLVTLGLDSSEFTKGTEKAKKAQESLAAQSKKDAKENEEIQNKAAKAQKERADKFKKQGDEAAQTFAKIRNHALSLMAVLAGGVGIIEFARSTFLGAASLGRLSDNLNIGIKDLQGWEYAARRVGASGEAMAASLEGAGSALANLKYNGIVSPQMEAFFRYGGGAYKMPTSASEMLLDEADMVGKLYAAGHHMEALTRWEAMGNSASTFNAAKHGRAALESYIAAGEKKAAVDRRFAKQSEHLQALLVNFRTTLDSVAVAVLTEFTPAITSLMGRFRIWADWLLNNKPVIEAWARSVRVDLMTAFQKVTTFLGTFVPAVEKFAEWVNKAVESTVGWKDAIYILLGLKVLSMVSPLFALAGALTSVGIGLKSIAAGTGALGVLSRLAPFLAMLSIPGDKADIAGQSTQSRNPEIDKKASSAAESAWNAIHPDHPWVNPDQRGYEAMQIAMAAGWTKQSAAAMAASFQHESAFNPRAVGDDGHALGVAQWHKNRQERFQKWYGYPLQQAGFRAQVQFAMREMEHDYPTVFARMQAAPTAKAASDAFVNGYEIPLHPRQQDIVRGRTAAKYYDNYGKGPHVLPVGAIQSSSVQNSVTHHMTHNHSEAHIDNVMINTQATDAPGIVQSFAPTLKRFLVPQINTGLS